MIRRVLILLLTVCALPVAAQRGLHVNELFEGHIISHERMVETQVRGKAVSKYGLTYFRSLRFQAKKDEAKRIEALILQDAGSSTTLTVHRVGSLATDIYMQLPPKGNSKRLLCYKYDIPDVLLIYMEGSNAVPETLENMFH